MQPQSRTLTRRTVLGAGVVAVGTVVTRITSPPASASLVRVHPGRADALVNSFGVGIHLNHMTSPYGQHAVATRWLTELGVRHVRTRLSPMPALLDAFTDLARSGIRIHGTCGALGDDQTMREILSTVRRRYSEPHRIFSAFEGINEPNNDGVPWVDEGAPGSL